MKKWFVTLSLFVASLTVNAQQTAVKMVETTPGDSITINMNVDFATLQLPPLSVLYANATSNPTVKMLEKERQLQKKLQMQCIHTCMTSHCKGTHQAVIITAEEPKN